MFVGNTSIAQKVAYKQAYGALERMLTEATPIDFQQAVFEVENAWYEGTLDFSTFQQDLKSIVDQCQDMIVEKQIQHYKTAGNWAIFAWMKEPCPQNGFQTYQYNFDDFLGHEDHTNTFITKLMASKIGTCYSMPVFYKCIAQSMGVEAKLTLGPNHAWIRHKDESGKWVNLELTSGSFPTDGWLMTQLGINITAINSGTYFRPLTEKESVALMLVKLAEGYAAKVDESASFVLQCVDLALKHYPNFANAWMVKANYLKASIKQKTALAGSRTTETDALYLEWQQVEQQIEQLGASSMDVHDYEQMIRDAEQHERQNN